jgi:ankyrin repeat protein
MDTPLNRACARGSLRVAEVMVKDLGAKINATGLRSGFSPLHAAALGGHCSIVRYLIQNGAKVNAAIVSGSGKTASAADDPEPFLGYTPLMLAVHAKDPWSVNELLLAGARKDARGLDQKTAQTLLQNLSATNDWDPVMATLASLLEPDATGVQRPQGESARK